jgi:hypothetical protein
MRTIRNVSFVVMVGAWLGFATSGAGASDNACNFNPGASEASCCNVSDPDPEHGCPACTCDHYCVGAGWGSGEEMGSCTAEVAGQTYEGVTCQCEGPIEQ